MHDAVVIVVKALAGGTFVTLFALLGEGLRPKWFAGLFGAAPAIAIAGLIVTVVDKGPRAASATALGMAFGSAGFVCFALAERPLLARLGAIRASLVSLAAWSIVGVGGYALVLR